MGNLLLFKGYYYPLKRRSAMEKGCADDILGILVKEDRLIALEKGSGGLFIEGTQLFLPFFR